MIRINLQKKSQNRKSNKIAFSNKGENKFTYVLFLVLILNVVGYSIHYYFNIRELEATKEENLTLKSKILVAKNNAPKIEKAQEELKQLQDKYSSIQKLLTSQPSTTSLGTLLEVSRILSSNGPTIKNSEKSFNHGWDFKRLWISTYTENDLKIKIEGKAIDFSDVSEFTNRIDNSVYFSNLNLIQGKKEVDATSKQEYVSFVIEVKVGQ